MEIIALDPYLAKAKNLPPQEADQVLARARRRMRRAEDQTLPPVEIVARWLQKEDNDLDAWRTQWAKITEQP